MAADFEFFSPEASAELQLSAVTELVGTLDPAKYPQSIPSDPLDAVGGALAIGLTDPLVLADPPTSDEGPVNFVWRPEVLAPIVNGVDAGDKFPSVVNFSDFCSGTLITPNHVLTAAHCTADTTAKQSYVRAGSRRYSVKSIIEHPAFDIDQFDRGFDLALVELTESVEEITPSAILRSPPQINQPLTLVGFGQTGDLDNGSNFDFGRKQYAYTQIDSITDEHIIWELDQPGEGNTAPGDSGGPAFVEVDGVKFIAGVTSGGDLDAFRSGSRSFDTRMDLMAPFIDHVLNGGLTASDDHPDQPDPLALDLPGAQAGLSEFGAMWEKFSDRDVYRLILPRETHISVSVISAPLGATPQVNLFNAQGQQLVRGVGSGTKNFSSLLSADDYFLELESKVPGAYRFSLSVSPDDQPGNGSELDLSQGISKVNGTLNFPKGPVAPSGDRDDFRFTLVRAVRVSLALDAVDSAMDPFVRLYNSRDEVIAFNNDAAPPAQKNSLLERFLQPGAYRINVGSFQDRTLGGYALTTRLLIDSDVTRDYRVDIQDFLQLRKEFGLQGTELRSDITRDQKVDINDFLIFRSEFGFTGEYFSPKPLPPSPPAAESAAAGGNSASMATAAIRPNVAPSPRSQQRVASAPASVWVYPSGWLLLPGLNHVGVSSVAEFASDQQRRGRILFGPDLSPPPVTVLGVTSLLNPGRRPGNELS